MKIARRSSILFYLLMALIVGGGTAVVGAMATPFGAWLGVIPLVIFGRQALHKPLRRLRLARQPFPPEWREWLDRYVPLYRSLDDEGKERFERDIRFVLDEWRFEGVSGIEPNDYHRLSVATGVAVMLHGREDWELSPNRTVLFYPDRFDENYFDGDYAEYDGMAHAQGPIILSIHAVEQSWARPHDGSNVVLHELAHLFDFDSEFADGVPSLLDRKSAAAWQRLVKQEMQRVRFGKSILRRYAATNPAELFAVAVEVFFEKPWLLRRKHPELYGALVAFFNLDPDVDPQPEVEDESTEEAADTDAN